MKLGYKAVALLAVAWGLLWGGMARGEQTFLPVEQVFKLSAQVSSQGGVALSFDIAPKTHLYRDRLSFEAEPAAVTVRPPQLPTGVLKYDEGFGKEVQVYYGALPVHVQLDPATPAGAPATLKVGYQGCADDGICYPPQVRAFRLTLGEGGRVTAVEPVTAAKGGAAPVPVEGVAAAADGGVASRIQGALDSGRWGQVVGVFFLAGILLAFTPCVLPMVPILSSIIAGDGPVNRWRGLGLAFSYSQGMALVYTGLGVAAGLAGEGLAASLQKPWVLGAMGALMVALALSMFGLYHLQMPAFIQSRLNDHSGRQRSGDVIGVFIMGLLSALIVGPCVSGPLAGALVYLSQTRDVVLGGSALYALALGMGVPLLAVGFSAGSLLPKAGPWMESVKTFFGVVLLAVGWWVASPVWPALAQMLTLAALLLLAAAFAGGFDHLGPQASLRHRAFKALGVGLAMLAALELVGAASGAPSPWDPLRPWLSAGGAEVNKAALPFRRVRNLAELESALAQARQDGRPVMLDFYADWCVSCKEMERYTLSTPQVRERLSGAVWLQADVTANHEDDKALLKRFGLFGPPGIIFFDAQGREVRSVRVIGYQKVDDFLKSLGEAGL